MSKQSIQMFSIFMTEICIHFKNVKVNLFYLFLQVKIFNFFNFQIIFIYINDLPYRLFTNYLNSMNVGSYLTISLLTQANLDLATCTYILSKSKRRKKSYRSILHFEHFPILSPSTEC